MDVMCRLNRLRQESERGQIIVMFALFLIVLMPLGSIVLDVGHWWVLRRHLQTQVDAAALAGGPAFTGCFQNPDFTTTAVAQHALRYAGDPTRDPSTHNLLKQDANDVHVVLNSRGYWSEDEPTDGSAHDWTDPSPAAGTPVPGALPGTPCYTKFLDVKATDHDAPSFWGSLPFYPDPKTRARVRVSQIQSTDGLRPLGVPEVDPEQVAVLIVNEDANPTLPDSVRGKAFLTSPADVACRPREHVRVVQQPRLASRYQRR